MKKKLTLAFDIEGTLLNKQGLLDSAVINLFKKADYNKTNFIFLTGGSLDIVKQVIQQINENVGCDLHAWSAVNGGSQIYNPNNDLVLDKSLNKDLISNLITASKEVDRDAVFMYATSNGNFVESQPKSAIANQIALKFFNKHDAKKGSTAMNLKEIEGTATGNEIENILGEIGDVSELYVVSLRSSKRDAIITALKSIDKDISVYGGKYIAVVQQNKLEALNYIISQNESMPDDVKEVVYFGDGLNDVECLSACDISVARGENAVVEAKQAAKYRINDLTIFADNLFKGNYKDMSSVYQK